MARVQSTARAVEAEDAGIADRRKSRRRIARTAFIVSVAFGAAVIILGMLDADIAKRVNEMSGFLQLYFGGLYAIIMAYFGVGSYENVAGSSSLRIGGKP